MTVRTRFAPSPTGYLHIGGARTALYSYLFARKHGGQFVLRVEDTDRERSTQASVDAILDGMAWLGLKADEGPFFQTERLGRYKEVLQTLLDAGKAYRCYCTREQLDADREEQRRRKIKPRYVGRCRDRTGPAPEGDYVLRFRSPMSGSVLIDDLVKGPISIQNEELDDLVLARSDGMPTYNFTVVVDDLDMQITHVIRGDDHVNNTPRQINIMEALDATPPKFAHVPMILGEDGSRLSKRHGAVSVLQYQEDGFLPEALLNYLVRLGWSHGDKEVFSLQEMIDLFDITEVNRSAAEFDQAKLTWLNQHYIQTLPADRLADELKARFDANGVDTSRGPALARVAETYRERARTMVEMVSTTGYLFTDTIQYDEKAQKKVFRGRVLEALEDMLDRLDAVEQWDESAIDNAVTACMAALDLKMGAVAQPLRVAVTGGSSSPSIGATLVLAGREMTLARLQAAVNELRGRAASAPTS